MGMAGQPAASEVGMFSDTTGNVYLVMVESTARGKIIRDQQLWGSAPTMFSVQRSMGGGSSERNIRFLAETNRDEAARFIGQNSSQGGWTSQHGLTFSSFYDLASQIEASGRRFPGMIVFNLAGEPVTLDSIVRTVLAVALGVVKAFGASFGISPALLESLTPLVEAVVDGRPVTLNTLARITNFIAPEAIRPWINDGEQVLSSVQQGNYFQAARVLGISDVRAVQDLYRTSSAVIGGGRKGMGAVSAIVQNTFNIDCVNKLRNQLRSGSVITQIIDAGSITRVPALQNFLVAVQAGGFVSTLPNVTEMVSTAINGNIGDLSAENQRAMIRMALGDRINSNDVLDLTIRALTEQAITQARSTQAKIYFLPASIPRHLRDDVAVEVAKQSGIDVVARIPGGTEWY